MRCAWLLLLALFVTGCAAQPPRYVYLSVPAAYLQPCDVPDPADLNLTYDLEDAFIAASMCAHQGNRDKAAIRNLPRGTK
jgi:hypothetical protein